MNFIIIVMIDNFWDLKQCQIKVYYKIIIDNNKIISFVHLQHCN